jgi:hypothetical protein
MVAAGKARHGEPMQGGAVRLGHLPRPLPPSTILTVQPRLDPP